MVAPIRDNPKMGSGISWRSAGTRSGDLRTAHVHRCFRVARYSVLEIATANTMKAT